jgi:hypothetical protein
MTTDIGMKKKMNGNSIQPTTKFQIRMEVMYSMEDGILEIQIDEVDEIKPDFFNNNKIGYDTYEAFYYATGEREVFKKLIYKTRDFNIFSYIENDY